MTALFLKNISVTNADYQIELDKGDYTFEVSAENYETGYFDVTVTENNDVEMDIKLQKSAGAIVITVTPNSSSTQGKYAEIHCVVTGYGYVGENKSV